VVSLKKIGVIATGALFVGATVGMAGAVTVPSDFKASMLADNGVAKAQLVVGKDAPGKDADTESAEIIQDAVKTKLAVSGVGGDITIKWQSKDLDGDGDQDDDADINVPSNKMHYDFKNTSLFYDADGDGRPDVDSDDYLLYNGVELKAGIGSVKYSAYLNFTVPEEWSYVKVSGPHGTEKIRDNKYFVTKIDKTNDLIKIGIPQIWTKGIGTDYSWEVEGREIFVDVVNSTATPKYVDLSIDGNIYRVSFDGTKTYNTSDDIDDLFAGTFVVKEPTSDTRATIVYVPEDSQVDLINDEEALGYERVHIPDVAADDSLDSDTNIEVHLHSGTSTVGEDEIQVLEGTPYEVEYDADNDVFRIRVSAEATVASGSKVKSKRKPGKYFLDSDKTSYVTFTITGGEEKAPELEIVNEDEADKDNMNLVLIGGPVANKLVEDLVTAGKSEVDWYNSDGDIEVIADAFADGKYAIIVAGRTREETRAAAEALADAL